MNLKPHQDIVIRQLEGKYIDILNGENHSTITFKAPTGSGKTMMIAESTLRVLSSRKDGRLPPILLISLRTIPQQGMKEIKNIFCGSPIEVIEYPHDLQTLEFKPNTFTAINWEKLNRRDQKNLLMMKREDGKDLPSIIENTKKSGNDIILLIDESHLYSTTINSLRLIKMIAPKLTIRITATPDPNYQPNPVEFSLEDAKADGLIKKKIFINFDFSSLDRNNISTKFLIEIALKKRTQLQEEYQRMGISVTVLCLIQLPNKNKYGIEKCEEVKSILYEHGITIENGKLGVWLSETQQNLEDIEKDDSKVEVLICKIAPTVGWNCRRASILVALRETHDFQFNAQTLGRILRTLFAKHYGNDLLDNSYVYTNLEYINLQDDLAKSMVIQNFAYRKNDLYEELKLPVNFNRVNREGDRLNGFFYEHFEQTVKQQELNKKISLNNTPVTSRVMIEATIENVDKIEKIQSRETASYGLVSSDVNVEFDNFLVECCGDLAPYESMKFLKPAVYRFFAKYFGFDLPVDSRVPSIVMSPENKQIFADTIKLSTQRFKEKYMSKNGKLEIVSKIFEVPEIAGYSPSYIPSHESKSILHPYYSKKSSKIEEYFKYEASNSDDILWILKNGDDGEQWFSVPYVDNGKPRSFFPDNIFRFKNGTIGIYETKDGQTAKDAGARSDALQKYISEQRSNGLCITGGIVIRDKKMNCWWIYTKPNYEFIEGNYSNWEIFNFKQK